MVGCDALGAMKAPFYELLCTRAAPKNEALFATLRGQVTRMNAMLPGSKRLCVHARMLACTHPSAEALLLSFAHLQGVLLSAGRDCGDGDARRGAASGLRRRRLGAGG
jgi:hypothetical protein